MPLRIARRNVVLRVQTTMNDLTTRRNDALTADESGANPQGKGANGFMLDWYQTTPRNAVAKPRRQMLAEYFTSMLVLSAAFKYRPAVGTRNYLYWHDDQWQLSLIAPDEWRPARTDTFAGECILQPDMTWTIEPAATLRAGTPVTDALGRFFDGFALALDSDLSLEDILPYYAGELPYYQRLFANALSRSLRASSRARGDDPVQCRELEALLPEVGRRFLPR